jgi:hypothetical protein
MFVLRVSEIHGPQRKLPELAARDNAKRFESEARRFGGTATWDRSAKSLSQRVSIP